MPNDPPPRAAAPIRTPAGPRSLAGASAFAARAGSRWLVVVAALLLAWSWSRIEGYQLADAVEYMEHARELVRGERVADKEQLRSFGFTTLLVPIFALAELAGFAREAAWLARALQIALTLALVVVVVRLAARFASPAGALVAGLLFVAQPIVLTWGISPVSDIAAGLAVALALTTLIEVDTTARRRHWVAGLWLGLALLMAYKTLPLVVPIVAICALRAGWRRRRDTAALARAIALCLLAQACIDIAYYGEFARSLTFWAHENLYSPGAKIAQELGLHGLAKRLYNASSALHSIQPDVQLAMITDGDVIKSQTGRLWYFEHLPSVLSWPAIALTVLGLARLLTRPSWASALLLAVIAFDLAALAYKSAKSFRLLLPVLPALAVSMAVGWDVVVRGWRSRADVTERGMRGGRTRARAAVGVALVAAAVAWSLHTRANANARRFGGFWRAADVVAEHARATRAARAAADGIDLDQVPPLRFACSWHWAVYLRETRDVGLVKLPWHLDYWERYDAEQRAADAEALAALDAFCVHLPLLQSHPEVHALVNELFEVHAVLYDDVAFEHVGPLYVLVARAGDPRAPTFWDLETDLALDAYRARHGLADPVGVFRKPVRDPESGAVRWQELQLLGYGWRPLVGGYGWLTYHWAGGPFDGEDYALVDRLTSAGPHEWSNDREPAYGTLPTSRWEAGWIVREGYLVVPEERPFGPPDALSDGEPDADPRGRRPLGGPYLAGDLVPASLWVKVVGRDDSIPPLEVTRLVPYPARPGEAREAAQGGAVLDPGPAIEQIADPGGAVTARGLQIDAGLMTRVGALFLGVAPRYARPPAAPETALDAAPSAP